MPLEERDAQVYTFTKRLSHRGVFAIIVIGIVLIAAGIVFFITYRKSSDTTEIISENGTPENTATTTEEILSSGEEDASIDKEFFQFETDTSNPFAGDADRDGLSNDQESLLGTSNTDIDSDNDGVSDTDEVDIWKTSPTNADTDGDGYTDGFEIFSGYNPAGEGELDAKFLDEQPTP